MRPLPHFTTIALAGVACALFSVAHAEPAVQARGVAAQTADGGFALHSNRSALGSRGAAAGQRGLVVDGQGNADASASSGFTTASGGQGLRSASFTRSADGAASGERSTSLTHPSTGIRFDASSSYAKGEGVSRSAACTDSAGHTVTCGRR